MPCFSKSGSVTAFHFEGRLPEVQSEDFSAALSSQRFRTIETAANEAESAGWVTVGDPTGDTFEAEDLEHGSAIWMRLRMDKKTLPARWVAIYRTSAERAAGRKLSVKEKRELKEDLMDKLLPRVLPTVRWVDALCFPDKKLVLLMSTSRGAIETFMKLFQASFSTALEPADPYQRAIRAGLDPETASRVDQVSPVRWPSQDRETATMTRLEEPVASPTPSEHEESVATATASEEQAAVEEAEEVE